MHLNMTWAIMNDVISLAL